MKKLFLYSIGITGVIVVFGLLFVFGIFDFSSGKSELIGASESNSEIDIHNKIVEYVHDVGNITNEITDIFNELSQGADISNFNQKADGIVLKKKEFVNFMDINMYIIGRGEIKEEFNNNYLPALEKCINAFLKAKAYFEAKPVTEENLGMFKGSIENAYNAYIEAHNSYTEVLNSKRKY